MYPSLKRMINIYRDGYEFKWLVKYDNFQKRRFVNPSKKIILYAT